MQLVHRIWGAILVGSHLGRLFWITPAPVPELDQLRTETAAAASLLRRTNTALDHCLVHQSFVSDITRVISLLAIEVTVLVVFWQLRQWWRSVRNRIQPSRESVSGDFESYDLGSDSDSSSSAVIEPQVRSGPVTPSSLRQRQLRQ